MVAWNGTHFLERKECVDPLAGDSNRSIALQLRRCYDSRAVPYSAQRVASGALLKTMGLDIEDLHRSWELTAEI